MKMLSRLVFLAFLSAITAEYLLGDQWLNGPSINVPAQIATLLLYAAYYGSAAILIREAARRTGRGWPTMLLLALAFGLLEEGIIDQSLFNPNFVGEHLLRFGFIPALGIAGPWTVFVLSLHVIWSISAPLAIAEHVFPSPLTGRPPVAPQTQGSWANVLALVAVAVLGVIGASAIFAGTVVRAHFMATSGQLIVSAAGVVALIVVAMSLPRTAPRGDRPLVPAILASLIATSLFVTVDLVGRGLVGELAPWFAAGAEVAVLAAGGVAAALLRLDVLGLASGAILTYCWLGVSRAIPLGIGPTIEQLLISAVVLGTVMIAIRRRSPTTAPIPRGTLEA